MQLRANGANRLPDGERDASSIQESVDQPGHCIAGRVMRAPRVATYKGVGRDRATYRLERRHHAHTHTMALASASRCTLPCRVAVGARASTSSVRALAPAARPALRATLASRPARLGASPPATQAQGRSRSGCDCAAPARLTACMRDHPRRFSCKLQGRNAMGGVDIAPCGGALGANGEKWGSLAALTSHT